MWGQGIKVLYFLYVSHNYAVSVEADVNLVHYVESVGVLVTHLYLTPGTIPAPSIRLRGSVWYGEN